MRRALTVVLLVVVGCSSATAETTSTVGGQAATTTTTTIDNPTTTAGPEAVCTAHPDGYSTDSRGFVCPPDIPTRVGPVLDAITRGGGTFTLLEGTFATRLFAIPLEFRRPMRGLAFGEYGSGELVNVDVRRVSDPSASGHVSTAWVVLYAAVDGPAAALADLAANECVTEAKVMDAARTIGGIEADLLVLRADCDVWHEVVAENPINFWPEDGQSHLYSLTVEGIDLVIWVAGENHVFDEYFTEVAEPIIDSIRFLDQ